MLFAFLLICTIPEISMQDAAAKAEERMEISQGGTR
jgi:hypothetical protein